MPDVTIRAELTAVLDYGSNEPPLTAQPSWSRGRPTTFRVTSITITRDVDQETQPNVRVRAVKIKADGTTGMHAHYSQWDERGTLAIKHYRADIDLALAHLARAAKHIGTEL